MAAQKGSKKTSKTTSKTTKDSAKNTQQLRKDINEAGNWPFPIYTKS